MAFKRMEPRKLTTEQLSTIRKDLDTQTASKGNPKSLDKNFPVFEVPVNSKVLIYVPNNRVSNEAGEEELRMDKPFVHTLREGTRFQEVRCIRDINQPELGYDGNCPLCDAVPTCWAYAELKIDEQLARRALTKDTAPEELLKTLQRQYFGERAIQEPRQYIIFPIVVIATQEGKVTPLLTEDGKLQGTPMWYKVSESQYTSQWVPVLENLEDEDAVAGGHWFILNYTYDVKDGKQATKMDSARNLKVLPKPLQKYVEYTKIFDEMCKDWTPEKAIETVVAAVLYSEEDLDELADSIIEPIQRSMDIAQLDMSERALSVEADIVDAAEVPKLEEASKGTLEVPSDEIDD